MRQIGKIGGRVFGIALVAAFGFGVSEAFATPAEANVQACITSRCKADCIAAGAPTGACIGGECECAIG
jgi:hypothetical protein